MTMQSRIPIDETRFLNGLRAAAEPLPSPEAPHFADAFERFGDACVVLLGEATHGTHEFYAARAAITRRLIERHGFSIVAVEGDWPDIARIGHLFEEPGALDQVVTLASKWFCRHLGGAV